MSPLIVGIIGIFALIALIALRMQIGISMALVGFVGFAYIIGIDPALGLLKTVPFST